MPHFVVLLHEMPDGHAKPTHWDLMLEDGELLRTWSMEKEPSPTESVPCHALPNHRKQYLNYEGPVSGNRGAVRQWDRGTFRWLSQSDACIRIELRGSRLQGIVQLTREDGDRFRIEWC